MKTTKLNWKNQLLLAFAVVASVGAIATTQAHAGFIGQAPVDETKISTWNSGSQKVTSDIVDYQILNCPHNFNHTLIIHQDSRTGISEREYWKWQNKVY